MPVQPREFLDHALELQKGTGEACARAAVSRAYYGALHRVIEIIPDSMSKDEDEGNTHRQVILVIDRLARSLQPGRTAAGLIARTMRQLRRSRVHADYELNSDLIATEVALSLGRSEKVFALCDDVERQKAAAENKS